jgi:hypothetical protein
MSLQLCRACGVEPSLLLHPLDFLGGDEVPELAFFPAMSMSGTVKRSRAAACLDMLGSSFEVVSLGEHAKRIAARKNLRERTPDAPGPDESGGAATDIATSAPLDTRMVEPRLTVENRRESGARNAS